MQLESRLKSTETDKAQEVEASDHRAAAALAAATAARDRSDAAEDELSDLRVAVKRTSDTAAARARAAELSPGWA